MITLIISGHIISWKEESILTKLWAFGICLALDAIYLVPMVL